jgi:hypothetical protein
MTKTRLFTVWLLAAGVVAVSLVTAIAMQRDEVAMRV